MQEVEDDKLLSGDAAYSYYQIILCNYITKITKNY
ncbi:MULTISPECIES: hypothetical protein [Pseudanabaena]|nr:MULTISPECIES: hypothetical protein [Pseudanabaena]MDG3494831.1 hypothetical protein [Pseudanabaena catenata USMAC16]